MIRVNRSAYLKDVWRTSLHNWKRFVSIAIIAMLGVAVLTGIYAGCRDAFASVGRFYERQRLYDIQIMAPRGFSDADIKALRSIAGVEVVQPEHSVTTATTVKRATKGVTVTRIGAQGLNQPYLQRGRLPAARGEVAVTERYLLDSGAHIGGTMTFAASSTTSTADQRISGTQNGIPSHVVITGVVLEPQNLTNPTGYNSGSFRSDSTQNYTVFAVQSGDQTSAVTTVSLRVRGAGTVDSFSQSYRDLVGRVANRIETSYRYTTGGWSISDRTQNQNFTNISSDLKSIESIGRAFPVVFLAVAVLMSLTAMTRMVEEDRGLIGTYLALGYSRMALLLRYLVFSGAACVLGAVLGEVVGFVGIPLFLLKVIEGLYVIPGTTLAFDHRYGWGGLALFLVAVCGATAFAYVDETRHMPAQLMRPKSPRAGSRLVLERIGWIWNRLSFLNKVTARNLFRFKGRLLMTVGGVAGCTALILCGLAINDTVATLGHKQYGDIDRYDLMVVVQDADAASVLGKLHNDSRVTALLRIRVASAQLFAENSGNGNESGHASGSEAVRLMIVPDGQDLTRMIDMRAADEGIGRSLGWESSASGRTRLTLGKTGILVAQSAATSLGLRAGSRVELGDGSSVRHETTVSGVYRNLIGSDVYISQSLYESLYQSSGTQTKQPFAANAALARITGNEAARNAMAARVAKEPGVVSSQSSVKLADSFSFDLMSAVVGLIVALAGGLALVVLFTLATTNVSERLREMATLKVLGFTDREVHRYVNTEMTILTAIGVLLGLPLGRFIGGLLTVALNMPSLHFEVDVRWTSYLIAAAVTMAFAFIVQWFINPVLDRIDPVSSLKSVE